MIGSYMNYFHLSFDQVVWENDFLNLGMLSATIPRNDPDEYDGAAKQVKSLMKTESKLEKFLNA
jgi:hypothetical protein